VDSGNVAGPRGTNWEYAGLPKRPSTMSQLRWEAEKQRLEYMQNDTRIGQIIIDFMVVIISIRLLVLKNRNTGTWYSPRRILGGRSRFSKVYSKGCLRRGGFGDSCCICGVRVGQGSKEEN